VHSTSTVACIPTVYGIRIRTLAPTSRSNAANRGGVVSCRVVSRRVCSHHRESQRNAPRRRRWSERASTPGLATGRNSNGTITAHLARYRHTIEGAGTDTGTTHPPLRFSATVRSTTRVSYY